MEIDIAFLADSAQVVEGKLYVMGGAIDTIWSKQLPVVYPQLSFVLKIIFDAAEIGRKHKLELQILDEDGQTVTSLGGDLEIPRKSENVPKGWRQGFITVLNFQNLHFQKFGHYSFNVLVNNSSLKSVPFRVEQHITITT